MSAIFAHSHPDKDWELLYSKNGDGHLNRVAELCGNNCGKISPDLTQWGRAMGYLHDVGKFSDDFQKRLKKLGNGEEAEMVDHSTLGSRMAQDIHPMGVIMVNPIAGHHSGLLDVSGIDLRMQKQIPFTNVPNELTHFNLPNLPMDKLTDTFEVAFFQRMLFSTLVDADFLATEEFMSEDRSKFRPKVDNNFPKALEILETHIKQFGEPTDPVNKARDTVFKDCLDESGKSVGIRSLTVPTGGGKTLSSMAFALKHAIKNNLDRIIIVIPFISIIEQNAEVYKTLFRGMGMGYVLEHHSAISNDLSSRLSTENWDAPIIVTTNAQFYESLHANRTSKVRKLHNIVNSVVVIDETQSIPTMYLETTGRSIQTLSKHYNVSFVLCTATQPALQDIFNFTPTEIVKNVGKLFTDLDRVEVKNIGYKTDLDIADIVNGESQVLVIVNTKRQARNVYELLEGDNTYHLSTNMTPAHRLETLKTIRERLNKGLPIKLISTQLIEAGVDIDFPVVLRSVTGIDSIAQSAGRCNREGKLKIGRCWVFFSDVAYSFGESMFADQQRIGEEVLNHYKNDCLLPKAVEYYFHKLYYHVDTDAKGIMRDYYYDQSRPISANFKTVGDKYKLIEGGQVSVIIPNEDNKFLIEKLNEEVVPYWVIRKLQRHTIMLYPNIFEKNSLMFRNINDGEFFVLNDLARYDKKIGLLLE